MIRDWEQEDYGEAISLPMLNTHRTHSDSENKDGDRVIIVDRLEIGENRVAEAKESLKCQACEQGKWWYFWQKWESWKKYIWRTAIFTIFYCILGSNLFLTGPDWLHLFLHSFKQVNVLLILWLKDLLTAGVTINWVFDKNNLTFGNIINV